MSSLLSLGRLSFWTVAETVWGQGERGEGQFLCQLLALSCVLHSSPAARYAQRLPKPKCIGCERPPGSLSSCWPVIPFWRIMMYSNCKSLGIIYYNVHGCFILCVLTCEIMWLISYVPFNSWICPYENPHTQTTKFSDIVAAYFANVYVLESWGWRWHQLISTCVYVKCSIAFRHWTAVRIVQKFIMLWLSLKGALKKQTKNPKCQQYLLFIIAYAVLSVQPLDHQVDWQNSHNLMSENLNPVRILHTALVINIFSCKYTF